jgi:hypothetical protein
MDGRSVVVNDLPCREGPSFRISDDDIPAIAKAVTRAAAAISALFGHGGTAARS